MKWEQDARKYSAGKILLLGKWKVGSIYYDSCRPKDDPLKYCASCNLPGIKTILDYYATQEEAMTRVETAITYWIKQANLLKGE